MRIVWDEPKRRENLVKHGLDFADLTLEFFDGALVVPAKRRRFLAIGQDNGATLAVVFALLGAEAVSIVSMRPASRKERNL